MGGARLWTELLVGIWSKARNGFLCGAVLTAAAALAAAVIAAIAAIPALAALATTAAAELFLYYAKHKHPMCGGHTSH